jgi:threonine/homoserine/homoserine lactone efflux protein
MPSDQLLAFLGVAIVVVVVPGPDMALVARNVARYGRSAGYATSIGICTGILGWAIAAAVGVAAILATSAVAFTALKLGGAAYLVYLGIATLRASDHAVTIDGEPPAAIAWRRAWAQGLVSSLLNPKLGVFFLTLLPQFVVPGPGEAAQAIQLAVVFDAIGLTWLIAYTAMLGALAAALARPTPRRVFRLATGSVLTGLGIRVALERS